MSDPLNLNLDQIEDPAVRTALDQVRIWANKSEDAAASDPSIVEPRSINRSGSNIDVTFGDVTFRFYRGISIQPFTTFDVDLPNTVIAASGTYQLIDILGAPLGDGDHYRILDLEPGDIDPPPAAEFQGHKQNSVRVYNRVSGYYVRCNIMVIYGTV